MLYYMEIVDCGDVRAGTEVFTFDVAWADARTGEAKQTIATSTLESMTDEASTEILKARAIVAYAESLGGVWDAADPSAYMDGVYDTVEAAFRASPDDDDLAEVLDLVDAYRERF